ncbi:MAG: alpha/beta hydrolase [Candidatus Eremiobacteraeota bacterium]|nr:alpha/beta hydrolase [Candidatus Eremiobacteraeota bacterium]
MKGLRTLLIPVLASLVYLAGVPAQAQLGPAATPTPGQEDSGQLAGRRFDVHVPNGSGTALYFGNGSLEGSLDDTRAVVIVHGVLRNADYYFQTGQILLDKAKAAHALLVAPQFIEEEDLIKARASDPQILRWNDRWPGGSDAIAPAPISTYDVFDAMIARLADRSRFPRMREIIIVGHSAGGQIVQRYAVVARAPETLRKDVRLHFIVANPSSYLYFDDWRPHPQTGCSDFNKWRYGLDGAPRYVQGTAAELEARYVRRDVTYLLGASDIDPQEWDLDRTCGGEAQGRYRFARGVYYIKHLQQRNPQGTAQNYAYVRGVAHDNRQMFTSQCGIDAIFGGSRNACAGHGKV